MNRIEFNLIDVYLDRKLLQILIDERSIVECLRDYEDGLTESKSIVGSYQGLDSSYLDGNQLIYQKLKGLSPEDFWSDKAILLFCGDCGFPGCWDMTANISVQGNTVIWSDFEQPHRGSESHEFWDYSGFGPFEFDSEQYFGELERARQQVLKL